MEIHNDGFIGVSELLALQLNEDTLHEMFDDFAWTRAAALRPFRPSIIALWTVSEWATVGTQRLPPANTETSSGWR